MPASQYARVATLFYMRRYWRFYAFAMALGVAVMFLTPGSAGMIFGIIFLLYPLTVPFRYSMVVGAKAAKFLQGEISYEIGQDELFVRNDLGGHTKGEIAKANMIVEINEHLVFLYGKSTYVILPLSPLNEDQQNHVRQRFRLTKR